MRTWPPALFPQSIEADWYNTKSVEACTDGSSIVYEVMFTPRQSWATLKGSAAHAGEYLRQRDSCQPGLTADMVRAR
jgi:hypothetical protein